MQKINTPGEYRQIRAPQQLRERVFSSCESIPENRSTGTGVRIMSLAACLVVILALASVLLSLSAAPRLSVNGEQILTEAAVSFGEEAAAYSARTSLPSGIRFELDISSPAVVRVSGGTLYLVENQSSEIIASGSAVYTECSATLIWDISGENEDTLTMSVTSSSRVEYILGYDTNGELIISKSRSHSSI